MKEFLKIRDAASATGLSQHFLRCGCRNGSLPCIKSGNTFYLNIPRLLEVLDKRSLGVDEAKTNG